MTHDHRDLLAELSADWMTWLVLRHFLPAVGQRVVVDRVVHEITGGTLALTALVDEVIVDAPLWNDAWIFRERTAEHRLAPYLYRVVSGVAWQKDEVGGGVVRQADESPDGTITPQLLELLLQLSHADYSVKDEIFRELEEARALVHPSLRAFVVSFSIARQSINDSSAWTQIERELDTLAAPLRFAATKHLADLWADVDRWQQAVEGYERALQILEAWSPSSQLSTDLSVAWRAICRQSIGGARRILSGFRAGAEALEGLTTGAISETPLRTMNASQDAFVARSHPDVDDYHARDIRVRALRSPLLAESQSSASAMTHWLSGNYDDAYRHWWAVLRRQIAMGAEAEARATRGLYARTIFEHVEHSLGKENLQDSFIMAVRLIIESGRERDALAIDWTSPLVSRYVDEAAVSTVLDRIRAHAGARAERERVGIAVLRAWIELLPPTLSTVAVRAWRAIGQLALEGDVHFESVRDVARPALEALAHLAKRRPEWSNLVAAEVGVAVLAKLDPTKQTRLSHEAALKVATAYLDVSDDRTVEVILRSTLDLLDSIDPEIGMFTVVRPALALLVSRRAKQLFNTDRELARRVLDAIFRFGTSSEGEALNVTFYLHDFDRQLLAGSELRPRLDAALEEIRRMAGTNSTSQSQAIDALLIAPALSGKLGLHDALNGLVHLLASSTTARPSLGLADGYDPLLDLCQYHQEIRRELGDEALWLEQIEQLRDALVSLWTQGAKIPTLFAPASFPPPTEAHPVVVHNWAFATQRFAEVFGHAERLESALRITAAVPALARHVALATATRAIATGSNTRLNLNEVIQAARTEDREGFYLALGRWLVLLQSLTAPEAEEFVDLLYTQVLKFGPRAADAAVLLAAFQRGSQKRLPLTTTDDYSIRLKAHRELLDTLKPIVDLLRRDSVSRPAPSTA